MKKSKKLKLKNTVGNGTAKNKTYTFAELADGTLVPRDPLYPVTGAPGHHSADGGAL